MFLSIVFFACNGAAAKKDQNPRYTIESARHDAQENITNGKLILLTHGEKTEIPQVDPETGLIIETMGCVIFPDEQEYLKEYNRIIRDYVLKQKKAAPPAQK